jgi:hypothetical protein
MASSIEKTMFCELIVKKHMRWVLLALFVVLYCLVCYPFELIAGNEWLFLPEISTQSTQNTIMI